MSTSETTESIGFIGLGDMGGAIAARIAEKGFPLTVFDLRADAAAALTSQGAIIATSPAALAAACQIIFICVANDQQVLALVHDQLAEAFQPGSILVIVSSVRPDTMHQLYALLPTDSGGTPLVSLLDAPVSGSRPAAATGTLTLMVGGDAATLNRARPVLESFSAKIFATGPLGSGQAMKIANNLMLHMNHLVALEAVRFARAQGIAEETLIEVVNTSSGRSWVTETWGLIDNMFVDHPQAGTTGIYEMMLKEMWNAVLLSRSTGTWLPLTGLGVQIGPLFHKEREAVIRER